MRFLTLLQADMKSQTNFYCTPARAWTSATAPCQIAWPLASRERVIHLSPVRTAQLQHLNPIDYVMQLARNALATPTSSAALADPLPMQKAA